MSGPEGAHRWVPPTWTWAQACALFEMDEPELREWVAVLNREAREDGLLEPIVVSDDGTHVTWVGSPIYGPEAGDES